MFKATAATKAAESRVKTPDQQTQKLQPVNSAEYLQHNIGNQAVLRMLRRNAPPAIQTKLTISRLGDSFEQEADRVADQVVRTADHPLTPQVATAAGVPPGSPLKIQHKCDCGGTCSKCQGGHQAADQPIQMKSATDPGQAHATVPPIVHQALRSPGEPLDGGTRSLMEGRFGRDLSHVRLHADATAALSARAIHAKAYAAGRDIVFGAGQFSPTSRDSLKLLAHELTHVIQQSEGARSSVQRQPDWDHGQALNYPGLSDMQRHSVAGRARSEMHSSRSGDPLKEMQRCIEGCQFSSTEERRMYAQAFLSEYYMSLYGGADSFAVETAVIEAERKFQATRPATVVAHIPDTAGTMAWVDERVKTQAQRTQDRDQMTARAQRYMLFERQKADIDQLTLGIPGDWIRVAAVARSIGRERPKGYYAGLGKGLLDNGQEAVDNTQNWANRATADASADNQKQLMEDIQILKRHIGYYWQTAAQISRLSTTYETLVKQWDQEPNARLIDGLNYEKRLIGARWAAAHEILDLSQNFHDLTPQQVWDYGKFDPSEKDRVFADQNDLIGKASRKRHEDAERQKVQAQIEQEARFIAGMEAAKHNELFLQPLGAEGAFMGLYNAAQIGALGGSVVNACRQGLGECVENAAPAIVVGVVTHQALKSGGVKDPVTPVPDPPVNVLPADVAGSKDPVFWTDSQTTTTNPTVGKLAPGKQAVTDISTAKKPVVADPKAAAGQDAQQAQARPVLATGTGDMAPARVIEAGEAAHDQGALDTRMGKKPTPPVGGSKTGGSKAGGPVRPAETAAGGRTPAAAATVRAAKGLPTAEEDAIVQRYARGLADLRERVQALRTQNDAKPWNQKLRDRARLAYESADRALQGIEDEAVTRGEGELVAHLDPLVKERGTLKTQGPVATATGTRVPCDAVAQAPKALRGMDFADIEQAMGRPPDGVEAAAREAGRKPSGHQRLWWNFKDGSRLVIDDPRELGNRAASADQPHAELHGPAGERLDQQGIVVPERSISAHMTITDHGFALENHFGPARASGG